ncbi:MAG TPA: nuclear transport factor 2 family protein [Trebonia sp.]
MTEHHESTRSASSDALLRELADRAAIQDLIAAYGLGQDLHQDGDNDVLAQWDQVFAPDATVDYSATARSPHIHTHKGRTGSADWNLIQAGYFVDRLERRPGGWRIVHRTLEITWMDTFQVTAQAH